MALARRITRLIRTHSPAVSRRKVTVVGTLPSKISIVGTGAVGSTLGVLLFEKGYTIVSIINRTAKSAIILAREVHCKKVSTSVNDLAPDTEVLIIAVSDDALEEVVQQAAKRSRLHKSVGGMAGKPLVLHTSGVHSLDVLKPFRKRNALLGSLHPIQSFPSSKSLRERVKSIAGIHFGVEGEGKALEMVQQLVRVLGGKPVVLPKGLKPLYHAACVFSSNYIITLLNAVSETAKSLGFEQNWKEIILPLFTTTVENAMKTSPLQALTGPVVRNDARTIRLHLDALQKFAPQLVPLYTVLGVETARVARQNGRLTPEQFQEFVSMIRNHVKRYLTRLPQRIRRVGQATRSRKKEKR